MANVELPEVEQAHHRRMRRVGPIDVPEDQRAGLHDAVDHARIHREVVDLEVLERVRHRRPQAASTTDGGAPLAVPAGCCTPLEADLAGPTGRPERCRRRNSRAHPSSRRRSAPRCSGPSAAASGRAKSSARSRSNRSSSRGSDPRLQRRVTPIATRCRPA